MEKKLKGFLIDPINGTSGVVDFVDKLDVLYKLLNCDRIDITVRNVGKFEYDVVCDDEGLLRDKVIPTAFDENNEPVLVGNLLFCNHDDEGNLSSITDGQIEELERHIGQHVYKYGGSVLAARCVVGMQ